MGSYVPDGHMAAQTLKKNRRFCYDSGEKEKATAQFRIAEKVMDAFKEDFVESRWFDSTVYDYTDGRRAEIDEFLRSL